MIPTCKWHRSTSAWPPWTPTTRRFWTMCTRQLGTTPSLKPHTTWSSWGQAQVTHRSASCATILPFECVRVVCHLIGGLVSAAGAAGVQAKVALIEDHLMGGDCLNVGCVPSKALIKAATVAHHAREAYTKDYGVHIDGNVRVDFGEVMQRMRRWVVCLCVYVSACL